MSVTYRKSRIGEVDIAEFRRFFVAKGWRATERTYGVSTPVLMQLIAMAGGAAVLAERQAVQGCGRKAGGAAPVVSNIGDDHAL